MYVYIASLTVLAQDPADDADENIGQLRARAEHLVVGGGGELAKLRVRSVVFPRACVQDAQVNALHF